LSRQINASESSDYLSTQPLDAGAKARDAAAKPQDAAAKPRDAAAKPQDAAANTYTTAELGAIGHAERVGFSYTRDFFNLPDGVDADTSTQAEIDGPPNLLMNMLRAKNLEIMGQPDHAVLKIGENEVYEPMPVKSGPQITSDEVLVATYQREQNSEMMKDTRAGTIAYSIKPLPKN